VCVCVCVDLDLADLHVLPRQVFSPGAGGGSIGHTDRGSDVKEKSTNTHILLVFAHTFLVDGLVFKSLTLNFERI
jgi:hypothetical protein